MFTFAHPRVREVLVPKIFLSKLGLFQGRPELADDGRYTITSDVDREVVELFFARVMGDDNPVATVENANQLGALCDELGFVGFDDEIRAVLGGNWKVRRDIVGLRGRVDRHDVIIEELQRRVLELERQLREQRGVPERVEAVERRVEEIRRSDLEGQVAQVKRQTGSLCKSFQQLKSEIRERASAADVEALSAEVARLKEAYRAEKDMVVTDRLNDRTRDIPSVPSINESDKTDGKASANKYALWVHTLDVSRMKIDTVPHNFATKEECIREMKEIISTYKEFTTSLQVRYQVDGGVLTQFAPRDFQSEIAVFIEDTKSSWSLLSEFLACPAQVTLEVECYNVKQIRMSAIFVSTQRGSDVYDFCKRLLEDVLLVDGSNMRVFYVNAQGTFEIEQYSKVSITRISGEGSKIVFSIHAGDPNKEKSAKASSVTKADSQGKDGPSKCCDRKPEGGTE